MRPARSSVGRSTMRARHLQVKYGATAGLSKFLAVFYNVMERSADIPSAFPAALIGNDDDGDLSNGTPDQCEIQMAFQPHGLTDTPGATAGLLGLKPPTITNNTVSLAAKPQTSNPNCPLPTIGSATLTWKLEGGTPTDVPLTLAANVYTGDIPTPAAGSVIRYHVTVTLSDASTMVFPDNKADPDYQVYVGAVTQIQCFDFEGGLGGWTHSGTTAQNQPGDEWEAGQAARHRRRSECSARWHGRARSRSRRRHRRRWRWRLPRRCEVVGDPRRRSISRASPTSACSTTGGSASKMGSTIRRRSSRTTRRCGPTSPRTGDPQNDEINHTDKEWRFADVDLTSTVATMPGMPVTLKFEVDADPGLGLGGWTLDDVCLVGIADPALCGNGTMDPGETCDDANTTDGDGCLGDMSDRAGRSVVGITPTDGGCCSTGTKPGGAIALSLFTLGLVLRRRKRK